MKISVITEDTNLVEYLKGNPSLIVENVYTDLETDYNRFINDLNRVDVLLMVDKSDLSSQLALLSKAVSSGGAYLFKVQEIVIVTYQDLMNSPTRNAEDKFNAFVELMGEYKYVVRVVKYPSFDFQAIYDGIIKETRVYPIIQKYRHFNQSMIEAK